MIKKIKILYRLFMPSILLVLFFGIYTNAVNTSELGYLKAKNIEVEESFLNKKQVSRKEAIYYLNYSDGIDCSNPSQEIKDKFNKTWWNGFQISSGTNLDDIVFGEDKYYCIAYGAYNGYIHGYSNGLCANKFCGNNNITQWEVIQMVTNILSTVIYKKYSFKNITKFKSWIDTIKKNYKKYGLTTNDFTIIQNLENRCENSCSIESIDEFNIYKKYCAYNLEDCGFSPLQWIEEGSSLLVSLNILMKENIFNYEKANNINVTKLVTGEGLIKWLYEVKQIKTVSVDLDYDGDNILNKNDNCLSTYNPSQADIDNDNIWDVCDNDIDGDWISNPVWIVDDNGNIVYSLIEKDQDNCLFQKNKDQADNNKNNIWDVCENHMQNYIWISISCNPLNGYKPFITTCNATTVGNVSKIKWDWGDLQISNWKTVKHTYKDAGLFVINATAIWENNSVAIASMEIKIWDKTKDNSIGFSIYGTNFQWKAPKKLWFATKYTNNNIDNVVFDFGEWKIYKVKAGKSVSKNFVYPGTYQAKVVAMKWNLEIAKASAQFTLDANDDLAGYGAYLSSSDLEGIIWKKIWFKITAFNFDLQDVDYILWDWGDGTNPEKKKSFLHYYSYTKEWIYNPIVKIYLENGKIITLSLTERISSTIQNNSTYWMMISSENLRTKVNQEISYTINLKPIQKNNIKKIIWKYGDTTTYIDETNLSLTSKHTYNAWGLFQVSSQVILKDNTMLYSSLAQVVYWNENCYLWALGQYNWFKCDLDKDGIPDVCDENIDGDNYNNLLGILTNENSNCSFTKNIINKVNLQKEYDLSSKWKEIDNCPFLENDLQTDSDGNGIWNDCETSNDSDSDWIVDAEDQCINLPENINGIEDKDGCPEISTIKNKFIFTTENCQSCPCHRADWDSELMVWDTIWAVLVNPYSPEEIYNISDGYIIGTP